MKKIKEFKKVYLEYPDEKILKDDELKELMEQKRQLQEKRIMLTKEEILSRLNEEERVYTR